MVTPRGGGRLASAVLVNTVGTSAASLVLPLVAFERLDGMTGALVFSAAMLVGRLAGSLIAPRLDRATPNILFAMVSAFMGLLQVGYFAVVVTDTATVIDLPVFFAFGIGSGVLTVTQFRLIGAVVPHAAMGRYYATLSALVQGGSLAGAAGVTLLGSLDVPQAALLIGAVTYVAAALLTIGVRISSETAPSATAGTWRSLVPLLPLVVIGVLPAVVVTIVNSSLPQIVHQFADGQSHYVGLLDIAFSCSALLCGLLARRWPSDGRSTLWSLGGALAGSALLASTAWFAWPFTLVFVAFALLAASTTLLNVRVFALLQQRSSPAAKGRVGSLILISNIAFISMITSVGLVDPRTPLSTYFVILVGFVVLLIGVAARWDRSPLPGPQVGRPDGVPGEIQEVTT